MQQLVDDGCLRLAGCVPQPLTLWRLSSWEMGICPVSSSSSAMEGPPVPWYRPIMRRMQELWKVSCWAAWEPVRTHDSAAPYMRRESTRSVLLVAILKPTSLQFLYFWGAFSWHKYKCC